MKVIEIVEFKGGKCYLRRLECRVSVEDLVWLNGSRVPINGSWYSYFISILVFIVSSCALFSSFFF